MLQIAAFVDVGYLAAQGSALLAGQKQSRIQTKISATPVLLALKQKCSEIAPQARLLRTYWYDGLRGNGVQTDEQRSVASSSLTKVRLGVVNSRGEQKEVDSLIVTDLIELARNRAITDALILSGDADIRVGMQIAQTFGVQVHLLGIKPASGSQSPQLIHEADTHHEWAEDLVSSFLTIQTDQSESVRIRITEIPSASQPRTFDEVVAEVIANGISGLESGMRQAVLEEFRKDMSKVPSQIDRPVLGTLKQVLQRELSSDERKQFREQLRTSLRSM